MGIEHLSVPGQIVWDRAQARDLPALPSALDALQPADRTALTRRLELWARALADDVDALGDQPGWVEATWSVAAVLAVGVCPGVTSAAANLRRVRRHLPYVR